MPVLSATRRKQIARQFDIASILPARLAEVDAMVRKILSRRATYEAIAAITGTPWYVIAVIHARESGCDFTRHLHNGDSLQARTWRVPAGRPKWGTGPYTFAESAGLDGSVCSDGVSHETVAFNVPRRAILSSRPLLPTATKAKSCRFCESAEISSA